MVKRGSTLTAGLFGVLSEAENDIQVFGGMISVSRDSRAWPDQELNSGNLDSASTKLDNLVEEQLDSILSGLQDIDLNPVSHVKSTMEDQWLQSVRGCIQLPSRMRFVLESGDETEKEISRLRELVCKLAIPAPTDAIIHDEINATDIKYLKLIAKLSGLIYDTYTCGDSDAVDPVIHSQVLPFILGGPNNHLLEAVSQAVDQYLSERQSEKAIHRLVNLEFSKMSRYRRYPDSNLGTVSLTRIIFHLAILCGRYFCFRQHCARLRIESLIRFDFPVLVDPSYPCRTPSTIWLSSLTLDPLREFSSLGWFLHGQRPLLIRPTRYQRYPGRELKDRCSLSKLL